MADCTVVPREYIDAIETQIAELSFRIDIAKHQLLTHLREFDAHEGWGGTGFVSIAAWLAWRIEIGAVAAREYVRVARALGHLRLVDAAFAAGKLSYSKVRAITRAATPETEQDFINIASGATASQIERLTSAYRRARIDAPGPHDPPVDLRRFVRRFGTSSGMVRIEAQLHPEQAQVVWEALSAALDAGRSETAQADASAEAGDGEQADASAEGRGENEQAEQADAFAEAPDYRESGESGDHADASAEAPEPMQFDPHQLQAERADALVSVAQAYLHHRPRTLGSGYELVVMTSPEQLEHGPGGVGGFLRDGTPVPLHMARMLACDCTRVDVSLGESGELLDVGRARRTVPSAIGRALWLRDGGCRVPGCGRKHHLHAHHLEAWAAGGKTAISNLVLLCPSHHALVHEGQLVVEIRDGRVGFRNVHGLKLVPVPGRGGDLEAVEQWLRNPAEGFEPDGLPGWDGSRLNLHDALSWMR